MAQGAPAPVYKGVPARDVHRARLRERLRSGLWFLPGVATGVAGIAAVAVTSLDRALGDDDPAPLAFDAGPDAAQQVLSIVAASMLTLTGLVFSITIVALQLASSQFSPRVLRTFLRDRGSQLVLGAFVGTFVYAFLVLLSIRDQTGDDQFVPGVAITVAFGLVLISVVALLYFIDHIAQSIRVVNIIETVAHETRAAIAEHHPLDAPDPGAGLGPPQGEPTATIASAHHGALLAIDEDDLIALASAHDCVLVVRRRVGDHLFRGMPVVDVHGGDGGPLAPAVLRHLVLGVERTMYQDVAFGFRQLVDIAEKALSPAINDPTTAVQVVDRLVDLLADLARRPMPSGRLVSRSGSLRVVVPRTCWEDYVNLAFSELRLFGAGSYQVARRLEAAMEDLLDAVPADRRPALDAQHDLLRAAVEAAFPNEADRALARRADEQGIGA